MRPAACHRHRWRARRSARLQLTVWVDRRRAWHALAAWGDRRLSAFDSPFELARFVARLTETPPRGRGGLR